MSYMSITSLIVLIVILVKINDGTFELFFFFASHVHVSSSELNFICAKL